MLVYTQTIGTPPKVILDTIAQLQRNIDDQNNRTLKRAVNNITQSEEPFEVQDLPPKHDFKALCKQGKIVMTPLMKVKGSRIVRSGERDLVHYNLTSYQNSGKTGNGQVWGVRRVWRVVQLTRVRYSRGPILSGLLTPQDNDGLLLRAFADANSATVDLLTELIELKGTLMTPNAVRQAALDIAQYGKMYRQIVKRLKRGETVNAQALKEFRLHVKASGIAANPFKKDSLSSLVVDAWMLYRFGISPVLGTFEDIREALKKKERLFFSVAAKEPIQIEETTDKGSSKVKLSATGQHRVVVRSSVKTAIRTNAEWFALNPLLTAWELIPQSWLIDRFISIGDFIQAHSQPRNIAERNASYSIRYDSKAVETLKVSQPPSAVLNLPGSDVFLPHRVLVEQPNWEAELIVQEVRANFYKRVLVGGPPMRPTITTTVNGWSLSMFGDAFALATQKLRR